MNNYSPELIAFYTELMSALSMISFTAFVVGCLCGAFFSRSALTKIMFIDNLFKRPYRVKTSTGEHLYRVKNVYLTKSEYDHHRQLILSSRSK